tara:strand:- start:8900 stop:9151 length:252 start_codon:yes stop_codon:yes gene_type:complete
MSRLICLNNNFMTLIELQELGESGDQILQLLNEIKTLSLKEIKGEDWDLDYIEDQDDKEDYLSDTFDMIIQLLPKLKAKEYVY